MTDRWERFGGDAGKRAADRHKHSPVPFLPLGEPATADPSTPPREDEKAIFRAPQGFARYLRRPESELIDERVRQELLTSRRCHWEDQ